jgi:hypothetical protein
MDVNRPAQPGNIHLAEHAHLLIEGDQFIGKTTVLQTVVQVYFP